MSVALQKAKAALAAVSKELDDEQHLPLEEQPERDAVMLGIQIVQAEALIAIADVLERWAR